MPYVNPFDNCRRLDQKRRSIVRIANNAVHEICTNLRPSTKLNQMQLTDYKPAALWLDQFNLRPGDRELAVQMLEKFRYVSNVDLASDLAILLEQNIPHREKAALYVERELQTTRSKKPVKMYKEGKIPRIGSRRKALHATGAARAVVRSPTHSRQQVGSEGVIAQQLTQLCARHRRRFLLQPSAEEIRTARVRHMVIVTDFIGTGTRILRMVASLWQVGSVRSWYSGKFVRIWVVCYSSTPTGVTNVQNHPSSPRVVQVLQPCPTLDNAFNAQHAAALKDLCSRYGQFHDHPLGYGDVGALIAFEHSCPNNAPVVFTEASVSHRAPWQPLFEKRATVQLGRAASRTPEQVKTLALETLRYPAIATAPAYLNARREKRNIILLLAALSRRHRHTSELVGILRMPLWELSDALNQATSLGLVDTHLRLTKVGLQLIRKLAFKGEPPVAPSPKNHYYPSVLRAPC